MKGGDLEPFFVFLFFFFFFIMEKLARMVWEFSNVSWGRERGVF